jgi:HPr kinase/phosphorylase
MRAMTVKDLIEEGRETLGLTGIRANRSGLLAEMKGTTVQVADPDGGWLNRLSPQAPLVVTKACWSPIKSSLPSTDHLSYPVSYPALRAAGIACLLFAEAPGIPRDAVRRAAGYDIPLLSSRYDEHLLESRMIGLLREKIDHITAVHGVLVACDGVGVLIRGDSGIGKTRCSIRLVERGHRWVADDCVEIEKKEGREEGNVLCGRAHRLAKGLLEVKPRGIVKAADLFAAPSICPETDITMIVALEKYPFKKSGAVISRGVHTIMGVDLPLIEMAATSDVDTVADGIESLVSLCREERANHARA